MEEINIDYLIVPELRLFENAINCYLTTIHILADRKHGQFVNMTNVNKMASECCPEKSATFESEYDVNKILNYLKEHELIITDGTAPYAAIATTENGTKIVDKYFVPTTKQREIEKIKSDLNTISNTERNAVLKRIAQSLIDANTSIATQQLLTELKILEKLDEISEKLDNLARQ